MADTRAIVMVAPGAPVNVELAGAVPVFYTAAVFRSNLITQLTMRGFRTITAEVNTGYGLASKDYTAKLTLAALAQMKVAEMRGQVASAAEDAGSYSATVSVPSIGELAQPELAPSIVDEGIGGLLKVPGNLFGSVNLIVIGLVVIVGLVAFGPNVKDIARRV